MRPTVLVIEDEALAREMATQELTAAGFTVRAATDGAAGLEMARAAPPECIVLDLVLPTMSGVDVLRALRADEALRGIPVIILSAHLTPEKRDELLALGAACCLTKAHLASALPAFVRATLRDWAPAPAPQQPAPPVRPHPRAPLRLLVEVGGTSPIRGYSVNVSRDGVFIETSYLLPQGREVLLTFTLPRGQTLEILGRVIWVRAEPAGELPAGMGIQFQDLTPEALALLTDSVMAHGGTFSTPPHKGP